MKDWKRVPQPEYNSSKLDDSISSSSCLVRSEKPTVCREIAAESFSMPDMDVDNDHILLMVLWAACPGKRV